MAGRPKKEICDVNEYVEDRAAFVATFPNAAMTKRTLMEVDWKVEETSKKRSSSSKRRKYVLGGDGGKVVWNSPYDLDDGHNMFYVVVRNKVSGAVSIFNAGKNIFPMMQRVKTDISLESDIAHDSMAHLSQRDSRALLTHTFGSRMAKKGLEATQMNLITDDNIVGLSEIESHLKQHGASLSGDRRSNAEIALEQSRRSMLPTYDLTAETPQKAYLFTEIVSSKDSACLKEILKELEAAKTAEELEMLKVSGKYMAQVIRRAGRVHEHMTGSDNKAKRRMAFQQILFLSYLLRFYFLGKRIKAQPDEAALAERTKMPLVMFEKILGLFSEKSREDMSEEGDLKKRVTPDSQEIPKINYTVTKAQRDKLICYMAIMTMMVEGYRNVDPAYFASDLKIDIKDALTYFKEVGCTVERTPKVDARRRASKLPSLGQYKVSLRAPLTFPKRKYAKKN